MTVFDAIRAMWALADKCGQGLRVFEALDMFRAVVHENNALRRRNERLVLRQKAHLSIVLELQKERDDAQKAARVAQTMAQHWRLKAHPELANYDERREDMPDAPTMPGTHGHGWDADGREVAS